MASITFIAQPWTMATTPFVRAVTQEAASNWQFELNADHTSLRMNWVVVTASNGQRRLRMHWTTDDEC